MRDKAIAVLVVLAAICLYSIFNIVPVRADSTSYGNGAKDLGDISPHDYTGRAGQAIIVNGAEDGVTFGTAGRPDSYANVSTLAAAASSSASFAPISTIETAGTLAAGNYTSLATAYDSEIYQITEAAGAPGIDVRIVISGVTDLNSVDLLAKYDAGVTAHEITIQVYNWTTAAWDNYGMIETSTAYEYFPASVLNGSDYISSGYVWIRLYHASSGNPSHNLYIDYAAASTATGGPSLTNYVTYPVFDDHTGNTTTAHSVNTKVSKTGDTMTGKLTISKDIADWFDAAEFTNNLGGLYFYINCSATAGYRGLFGFKEGGSMQEYLGWDARYKALCLYNANNNGPVWWFYEYAGAAGALFRVGYGNVNVAMRNPIFDVISGPTCSTKTYGNQEVTGNAKVYGNMSGGGTATVGGNVSVWGRSDTYGPVACHQGIEGLVAGTARAIYINYSTGSDAGDGSADAPYLTNTKMYAELPAIYPAYKNYSIIPFGRSTENFDLSNLINPSSGIFIKGQTTVVDSGTATSGSTPATWPDDTAVLTDSGKSWTPDAYVNMVVSITGGTGSGQKRFIRTNDGTNLYVESKWATAPNGTSTYEIYSFDWVQQAPMTFTNCGNIQLTDINVDGPTAGSGAAGIFAINSNMTFNQVYAHDVVSGSGIRTFSCPLITANNCLLSGNAQCGVLQVGGTTAYNYNAFVGNTQHGLYALSGATASPAFCDSRDNTLNGYRYESAASDGRLFNRNRSKDNVAGDYAIEGGYVYSMNRCLGSGYSPYGLLATGSGQATIIGASTFSNHSSAGGTYAGIQADNHGGIYGYSLITLTNNDNALVEDATSMGYIDN